MKQQYENTIRLWFDMWLQGKDLGIEEIFSAECVYIESWGPKYTGKQAVKRWFDEWNKEGQVLVWDIKQVFHNDGHTAVEWYFRNSMKDGHIDEFDGVTIVQWSGDGKIQLLKEFGRL